MLRLPDALAPFAAYRQFILYRRDWNPTKNKYDKLPIDHRTGRMPPNGTGGAHWREMWTDAQTAIEACARYGDAYGLAFVFCEDDPFWFFDLDKCLLPDRSGWSPLACQMVAAFPGAAIEVSTSGDGLHIFGTGTVPPHGCRNTPLGLEFYTTGRFVALTGTNATGDAGKDFTYCMPWLVDNYFPLNVGEAGVPAEWTDGPCEDWNGPTDDAQLLERAMRSQSAAAAFGNKASFRDLFECNVEVLARAYPADPNSTSGLAYDASSVDKALAHHLAFWTGKDCARIQRIMLDSALVRPKWDRDDYLPRTILAAVTQQVDYLTDKLPEPVAGAHVLGAAAEIDTPHEPAEAEFVTGATYMFGGDLINLFKGCVYVYDINRILVPGGLMLKADQFKVRFGGYTMVMDADNTRTSKDAYEAFTQNEGIRFPRADGTCFKPNRKPGEVIRDAGRSRVNVWWPVEVPRAVGDVTPFIDHLAKLLPDERDRTILLSYMAACVQYRGYKIQWAPLLQGVEGNGKTLLTCCVAEAIGRRYVHWPKASKLSKEFNAWMRNKLFYGVEDIYVPGNRREVIEELKPMITGENLEIEGKGVDQVTEDICGNFMFNSNHKDAIAKTRNDRRFCVLFTAQQCAADLIRDGMTGTYFPRLQDWLRNGGFAIVSELLHTWPIPDEFNPTTQCQRAPTTTSTEEAIGESLGGVEQEIMEAIAQGLPGFAGGWVSSMSLDTLLGGLNAARRVPHNKRRELMASLGYMPHPGLRDGRVNSVVLPDGGKPKLFIRVDHPHQYLIGATEIARAYSEAQSVIDGNVNMSYS